MLGGATDSQLLLLQDFFFNDTATTEIYTLSLHDALPISELAKFNANAEPEPRAVWGLALIGLVTGRGTTHSSQGPVANFRSEEHTSELQSRQYLVCRLLLEKKKKIPPNHLTSP